ncbi:hypothetical protein BDN67DRAFT_870080, partial [Paxillus ammoniavirescens]
QQGLYGMKQVRCVWSCTINEKMIEWGFVHPQCEHCIYYQCDKHRTIICTIHINDFLNV